MGLSPPCGMIRHEAQRCLQMARYFCAYGGADSLGKLHRLMYLADFRHFTEIGRSITGCRYQATSEGPLSVYLEDCRHVPGHPLAQLLVERPNDRLDWDQDIDEDLQHFTPRQIRIMRGC